MTYVVESGSSAARRSRRRRAGITLLLVALLLFFAFWYAYSYYRGDPAEGANRPTPCATASTTAPAAVTPQQTIVNVYNATSRSGLAAKTAAAVRKRGFVVEDVANDPLKKSVKGTAEVRFGPKGASRAKLVVSQVAGSKGVKDKRKDDSVDLVLGAKFTTLAPLPTPTTTAGPGPCAS